MKNIAGLASETALAMMMSPVRANSFRRIAARELLVTASSSNSSAAS